MKTQTANRLRVTWSALLDESAAVAICHAFELGGTIDALGDVAFVRDEIMVSFLLDDKLANLARPYGRTSPDVISGNYRRVWVQVQNRGLYTVVSGGSL